MALDHGFEFEDVGKERIYFGLSIARKANLAFNILQAVKAGEDSLLGSSLGGVSEDKAFAMFESLRDEAATLIGRESSSVMTDKGLISTIEYGLAKPVKKESAEINPEPRRLFGNKIREAITTIRSFRNQQNT